MRKRVVIISTAIAVCLIVMLGFFWTAGSMYKSRDPAWYAEYTAENGSLLKRISDEKMVPRQTIHTKRMLRLGGIEFIHFNPDATFFFLKTSILEGHYMLIYSPDANYIHKKIAFYDGDDDWRRVETADGSCLWEGGAFDKGYVRLYNLEDGFYLEEAYLPT